MATDDRLDPDLIRGNLQTRRIGGKVLVYECTSSTNDVAFAYARSPDNSGLVVFAEEQIAGRGRTGARWHSRRGDSLLLSVLLVACQAPGEVLSLACAVALAEAIGHVGGEHARIKWPNDIMLRGRKVAGILVESRHTGGSRAHVIGIGINCHQQWDDFPPDLQATATSLDLGSGTRCERNTLARRVLTSLDHWLDVAERNRLQVVDAWSGLSTQLGQRVTMSYAGRTFSGNCIGVDPEKGLILQLDRGGVRMFDAAHAHIVR
jgi:BirA family biotin operon repressor/biotin-[acetyl-CoA-carboxylase] ligase